MATYTENCKLKKPAPEDFADIADLNENADKIDAALKDKADLDESGKLKESQLPSLSFIPTSQKGAAGEGFPPRRQAPANRSGHPSFFTRSYFLFYHNPG